MKKFFSVPVSFFFLVAFFAVGFVFFELRYSSVYYSFPLSARFFEANTFEKQVPSTHNSDYFVKKRLPLSKFLKYPKRERNISDMPAIPSENFSSKYNFKTLPSSLFSSAPLSIPEEKKGDNPKILFSEELPLLLPTPEKVKGVYLTAPTFLNPSLREKFISLAERTEINAFVIDIAGDSGRLSFVPANPEFSGFPISRTFLPREDYKALLSDLQNRGIYTIARIVTFKNPAAVEYRPSAGLMNYSARHWTDWKGSVWLDMSSETAWEIPVLIAKEVILLGFDEVQFDYIRFPSDGNISSIKYKNFPPEKQKFDILRDFFAYAHRELKPFGVPLSVDLFGLTYQIYQNPEYALGIGQRLVDAAPYFDYISPMVYPSHYGSGHFGLLSPVHSPYELVTSALKAGHQVLLSGSGNIVQSRPWLQDFDLGADYDRTKVRAQIRACDEQGTSGWLLWNARNVYTEEALLPEK